MNFLKTKRQKNLLSVYLLDVNRPAYRLFNFSYFNDKKPNSPGESILKMIGLKLKKDEQR